MHLLFWLLLGAFGLSAFVFVWLERRGLKGPTARREISSLERGSWTVALLVLGIFLALVIQSSIDTLFSDLRSIGRLADLRSRWALGDLPLGAVQVAVFLSLIVRFFWGAYRFVELGRSTGRGSPYLSAIGTFLLFALFYITTFSLASFETFYLCVAVLHQVDLLWFLFVISQLSTVERGMYRVLQGWIRIDLAYVALFLLCYQFDLLTELYPVGQWVLLGVLFIEGVLDLWLYFPFYRHHPNWQDAPLVRIGWSGQWAQRVSPQRKRVFICSRLSDPEGKGETELRDTIRRVRWHCRQAVKTENVAPFAPHAYFTEFLDDRDPTERRLGQECGKAFLEVCDAIYVYTPDGKEDESHLSEGMKREVELAKRLGLDFAYVADDAPPKDWGSVIAGEQS